jgi:hypothetical protein
MRINAKHASCQGIEMNAETLAHHVREEMALVSAAYLL